LSPYHSIKKDAENQLNMLSEDKYMCPYCKAIISVVNIKSLCTLSKQIIHFS